MPPPYKFGDPAPGFFDKQRDASIDLQLKLGSVLSMLAADPVPDTEELRALPLMDRRLPDGFTVTFDGSCSARGQSVARGCDLRIHKTGSWADPTVRSV